MIKSIYLTQNRGPNRCNSSIYSESRSYGNENVIQIPQSDRPGGSR